MTRPKPKAWRCHGKGRLEAFDWSDETVALSPGWTTPRWVRARILATDDTYPAGTTVRAEVVGKRRPKAIVTTMELGDGKAQVTAKQLRALAQAMPDLAVNVLDVVTLPTSADADAIHGSHPSLVKALREASRAPGRTQLEREDDVLAAWENVYQPKGMTQGDAAREMGLAHSTFRSYLTHARARRGK